MSNGFSSPFFTANGINDQGLQSFDIKDYSTVKRVKGSKLSGSVIHKISFSKQDGTEISQVELLNVQPYGPECYLADDEEIIGVYGTKD